jgi:hypothetical protein
MQALVFFMDSPAVSASARAPDVFRIAFMEACISDAAGQMVLPSPDVDRPASTVMLEACANALPLTSGARQLVRNADRVFMALRTILLDRSFRSELRAYAREKGRSAAAGRLIALAGDLRIDPKATASAPPPVSLPATPSPGSPPPAAPPRSTPVALPPSLADFAAVQVSTSSRTADAMRVGELVAGLADPRLPLSLLTGAMRSLAASPHRVALVLLHRAVTRGEVVVRTDVVPRLLIETIRAFIGLNANASAYALSAALLERHDPAGSDALPHDQHLRLMGLHARLCMRTGRVAEAQNLLRRLHMASPEDPKLALEYFLAISTSTPEEAAWAARGFLAGGLELDYNACLALAEFFIPEGRWAEANGFMIRAARIANGRREHILTAANIALHCQDEALWCQLLQEFGRRAGMPLARHDPATTNRVFSFEGAEMPLHPCPEPISVIMTAFNSIATIEAAIDSVLAQRGVTLELIVIDDGSTDETRERLAARAAAEPRLRVVMTPRNMGTYAAKNHGIAIAQHPLIAFHDSDDWMHPMHLHRQAEKLLAGYTCTTSQWLRMRADGHVIRRRAGGYTHLNPASTLFRRAVTDEMGPFDFVRTGADAEYLTRIQLRYGWSSVLQMEDCLALGLHHEGSLTRSGATAFDEHRYSPVRLAYTEAWVEHHLAQMEQRREIALRTQHERPFEVPTEIRS